MANRILYISSCIMFIFHLIIIYIFNPSIILQLLYIIGCITSILNHGSTNIYAKYTDRIVMVIGCLIDIYFNLKLPSKKKYIVFIYIAMSVLFYFSAKYFEIVEFHYSAHIFISIAHLIMLSNLDKKIV